MADTFLPPANLKDFNRSDDSQALFRAWHRRINGNVNSGINGVPAFYNVLNPPSGEQPQGAAPEWTGLPRTIRRLVPGSVAEAAALVDRPVRMGAPDPTNQNTPPFHDASGAVFNGPAYRPQDEYLEWVARRASDGTINEVIFTCEGPEYWENIALDHDLLLTLYKELVGDDSIVIEDLLFPRSVTWANPFSTGLQRFNAGDYNPYNKWNIRGAVHLTQPANTLEAEIALAKDATRLYGNPDPVTADPELVCCALYGGINRMSDPSIGSGVNTQVQLGNRVTLRNPIGLYMKAGGLRATAFTLPNGDPFTEAQSCFEVIRPDPADVTDMIVRARFRVPDGLTFEGRQLRVGDLRIDGEQIVTGGQVADVITMTLFAEALPGAPPQQRVRCQGSPCPDSTHPEIINVIPFGTDCPTDGLSPQEMNLEFARASALDPEADIDAGGARSAAGAAHESAEEVAPPLLRRVPASQRRNF